MHTRPRSARAKAARVPRHLHGLREPAKQGRWLYRLNLPHGAGWQGRTYAAKQVAPVVVETDDEFVVITVYTFYF